jgi:hypothetical protein
MPVPKEVVEWLDQEEEALAHHNLLILNYKIFGRLQLWFEELFVVAFEVLCVVGYGRASAGGHVRCGTQARPGAIQAT